MVTTPEGMRNATEPRRDGELPRLGLAPSVGAAQKLLKRFHHETRLRSVPGHGHLYAPHPKSLIAAIRAGVDRDSGRISRMYYLTRAGAEQVAEFWQTDPAAIWGAPKSVGCCSPVGRGVEVRFSGDRRMVPHGFWCFLQSLGDAGARGGGRRRRLPLA